MISGKDQADLAVLSSFLHCSLGMAPQKLQGSPSLFRKGLLLAQVPENSPSFLAHILMAIPANPNPINTVVIKKTVIIFTLFNNVNLGL